MSVESQPTVQNPDRFVGHRVRLPIFEGPLDLLLYLLRAHKYDICDIPIREITTQFVEYLALMREVDAEYAGDFLVTAATLMQIKSRMLLPKHESQNEDVLDENSDLDPRAELVSRLLEYERIQDAAQTLRERREERADLFSRPPGQKNGDLDAEIVENLLLSEVSSFDLLSALRRVLKRVEERPVALVRREPFSLPDRIKTLAARLKSEDLTFAALCDDCESRLEVVLTFLAVLELIRRGRASLKQEAAFGEICLENKS